ncbi:MAG: IS3 family transposase [Bifidobacterium pseudolongum]|nr:IS3 family transposase [Bifidobacterium pseudolongum]
MVKYSREQRLRAVRLYEQYDRSAASVISELGYPSRPMLARWHRAWVEAGRDDGRPLDDGRGERYTPEQKRAAVDHYLRHGRCLRRTLRALGYPSHEVLARWIDELEPGRRRLRRAPVDEATRRRAVVRYACGEATSRRIGEELGVSADVVRNWKHTMLSHDDKERRMRDEDARRKPEPAQEDPTPSSGACRPIEDMRRERDELVSQVAALRAERLELEIELEAIRYTKELLGKGPGADPDNLTNAERTRLVLHLADRFAMKPRDLLGRCGLSRSTFYDNRKRLGRPDRDEWPLDPVRRAFEQSHGRYGYRRIWQVLREQGIRVCAKRIMRVMTGHGIVPKLRSRRRYNSYSGEHTPAPANLVNRRFHAKEPNRLWVTDITEFHTKEGKVYLSPVIDCYDGMPVAWSIGTSPTAELADTMLEQACATLKDGERPVIHSDRGCHYRWPGWIRICERHGLTRSMSAKGCSPDNAAAEGFFGRLKQEFYYNRDHRDDGIDEFIDALEAYMVWYRDERIKTQYGTSITKRRRRLGLMA